MGTVLFVKYFTLGTEQNVKFYELGCVTNAIKEQNWKQAELKVNNTNSDAYENTNPLKIFDENNYIAEEIPIESVETNERMLNSNSETKSEEDKELYEKRKKEAEEYRKKGEIVNDLLEKFYPTEYAKIQDEIENEKNKKVISISLKQYEADKAKLIVELYNEQKLSNEEKKACRQELTTYYEAPEDNVKLENSVKNEIEKILK